MKFGNERLIQISNRTAAGDIMTLDGHYFTGCHFIGCEVHYNGGNWGNDDTVFENCKFLIGGQAQFVLETVSTLLGRDQWERLFDALREVPPPTAN